MKGFSKSNLKYMRRWYTYYSENIKIGQQAVDQLKASGLIDDIHQSVELIGGGIRRQSKNQKSQQPVDLKLNTLLVCIPWGHHLLILTKTKSTQEAIFYLIKTIQNGWSRSILQEQIVSDLFNRQGQALTNFDLTLPKSDADLAKQTLKNPYNLDFLTLEEDVQEIELERALIQNIKKFLLELGKGFAYVGNQFNINVEGDDFFLDLLFFNINLNRYVVVELKVGDFKPEFAGKLNMYVNAVNDQIKLKNHKSTIGVLLCRTPNKTVIEYSIENIDSPIGISDYAIRKALPKELKSGMPTKQELENELTKELEISGSTFDSKLSRLKSIIASSGKIEVKEEKNSSAINKIVKNIVFKLIDKIDLKIKDDIVPLFTKIDRWYSIDSKSHQSRSDFLNTLKEVKTPNGIKVECYFQGLKKAGVKAFDNHLGFSLELLRYKYSINSIYSKKKEQDKIEKLYHQTLNEQELDKFALELVEKLIDDITEYAEVNI